MTTAARPTFDPAKGGAGVKDREIGKLSHLVSSRDLPAHLTLKERLEGQDTIDELKHRNFKQELEEREKVAQIEKSTGPTKYVPSLEQAAQARLALKTEKNQERESLREALLKNNSELPAESVKTGITIVNARKVAQLDKDEDFGSDNDLSESDFEDDDDDEVELMAELNKIKQERQEDEQRERDIQEREDRARSVTSSDTMSSFSVKRRWDDDVPFKNCARGESEARKKLYVNDTLRQEFHQRFMDKYIK